MLEPLRELTYTIVLCHDIEAMKTFYRRLLPFPVTGESETTLTFGTPGTLLSLRQRTRGYDGTGTRGDLPGMQLAFRVERDDVDACHRQLREMGVTILDPPADQPRGHRTVYFADPEGNQLEVYAEI